MISWVVSNFTFVISVFGLLFLAGLIRYFFGSKVMLPIYYIIGGLIIFIYGKKIERDNQTKYVQDIQDKREQAYDKINKRNTNASDVADRLRKQSF